MIDLPIGWPFFGYLLGSIPIAWLLTQLVTGQDLRQLGSGNVGVMNTALSTARWAGLLVFLTEVTKGALAVALPRAFGEGEFVIGLCVLATVMGTRWPVWLGFKGGRGNSVGWAALVFISWQAAAVSLALWGLLRLLTRSSFTATRLTLLLLPAPIYTVTHSWWYALVGLVLGLIYLSTQRGETDDHLILKERWPNLWAFLTSPPRDGKTG
jgi:glycerol-3-phosphate acyltransferase PlsY